MSKRTCLAALLMAVCLYLSALPTWTWVDTYGSPELDTAGDMVTDSQGNVYFCGSFKNTIVFDESNSLTANPLTSVHMFLCKLDPLGNVVWAFQNTNTGANNCYATALAVDSDDNLYMGGHFTGNMTLGGSTLSNYPSGSNAFFAKVEPSGNVSWIQGGGGTGFDKTTAVALDPLGQPVFAGTMTAIATFGLSQLINSGAQDIFVVKLDANGQWLNARRFGADSDDVVEDIAINAAGQIFLTGNFNVNTSFDSFNLSGYGGQTVYVSKLDQNLVTTWCSGAGGSGSDMAKAITLGSAQTAYITGVHGAGAVFGSTTLSSGISSGIFSAAIDETGNWLWASSLGANSSTTNQGSDILRRADGDLIVIGQFQGTISGPGYSLVSNGNFTDVFVARLSSMGQVQWAQKVGGSGSDTGSSLAGYAHSGYYVYGNLSGNAAFGDLNAICDYHDNFLAILSEAGLSAPVSPGPVLIQITGSNCHLSWPEVTLSTDGESLSGVFYKVYRASRPDFSDEVFLQQTSLPFYEESLPPETHYFYRVRAVRP